MSDVDTRRIMDDLNARRLVSGRASEIVGRTIVGASLDSESVCLHFADGAWIYMESVIRFVNDGDGYYDEMPGSPDWEAAPYPSELLGVGLITPEQLEAWGSSYSTSYRLPGPGGAVEGEAGAPAPPPADDAREG
jgi:hypothetical protein